MLALYQLTIYQHIYSANLNQSFLMRYMLSARDVFVDNLIGSVRNFSLFKDSLMGKSGNV